MGADTAIEATFQRETLSLLWPELMPLFRAHWREIAHYGDIPLDPDRARYDAAERAGQVRLFTVRKNWVIIGYAIFFVNYSAHYRSSLQAVEDVIFIAREYRRGGFGAHLVSWCDQQLAAEGVQLVMHHVKTAHNFGPMLERLGYEHVEQGYWKRLDQPKGATP